MFDYVPEVVLAALIGAFGGIVLGLAARLGRFCTLGAIEDALYQGSDTRLRMWGLAIGSAGFASFALVSAELLDVTHTIYHQAPFSPLAIIIGGLLFGYGMAIAGNCGFGALARFGGGDLRSFVIVLVMGISAYAMLSGPFAAWRVFSVEATQLQLPFKDYPSAISQVIGVSPTLTGLLLSGLVAAVSIFDRQFLSNRKAVIWGILVGLAIACGWAGTSWIAREGFEPLPVVSHTFAAPLGETLIFLMTSSGGGISFGVGSVFGVLIGAFAGSLIKGHFRWEACEDPRELKRQVFGAVLMGFGAILALGCTVGQGISAFSIWALSAPIVFVSIFIGAALGLRQLIAGFASSFN